MIRAKSQSIKIARIERGLAQSDVSTELKINISNYCRMENGKAGVTPKTAKRLCDFYGKGLEELFEIV